VDESLIVLDKEYPLIFGFYFIR